MLKPMQSLSDEPIAGINPNLAKQTGDQLRRLPLTRFAVDRPIILTFDGSIS
jgi:hypothetical protein